MKTQIQLLFIIIIFLGRWSFKSYDCKTFCTGEYSKDTVQVNILKRLYRWTYHRDCTGECIEGTVQVNILKRLYRWIYLRDCTGEYIKETVQVNILKRLYRWIW